MFKEESCPFRLFAAGRTFDGIPDTSGCESKNLPDVVEKAKEWEADAAGLAGVFRKKRIQKHKQVLQELAPDLQLDGKTSPQQIREPFEGVQAAFVTAQKDYPDMRPERVLCGTAPEEARRVENAFDYLNGLGVQTLLKGVEEELDFDPTQFNFKQWTEILVAFELREKLHEDAHHVHQWADRLGVALKDLSELYSRLNELSGLMQKFTPSEVSALGELFHACGGLLEHLGCPVADVSGLSYFLRTHPKAESFHHFIAAHIVLSHSPDVAPPDSRKIREVFEKNRKLNSQTLDNRFAGLQDHSGDIARVLTSIDAGKQLNVEQARVLLSHLSALIAEAPMISKHLPMEADLIDLLIIDEASQVSIADSISLMLRAKQTIIFGDELQYGAVGAQNVSRKYSEAYFKEILGAYGERSGSQMSSEEADQLAREASEDVDEETQSSSSVLPVDPGTREWLKTFSIRTSILAFAKALQNYSVSLNTHFRSYPEIISYSNDFFYRPSQIELVTNRIRNQPIGQVLRFMKVETKGLAGKNVNLDEIEAIQQDIETQVASGYAGTIGIICSFKDQAARMENMLRREMEIHPKLEQKHKFKIWFVGDVQGEERDTIYYSLVQDKKIDNADLRQIYPTIGGTADDIRKLKMQRLNVGFSRAKDRMVFVHSMPIGDYSDTRLGDALRHYQELAQQTNDHYVEDESIFDSPAERQLYTQLVQTPFFIENKQNLRLIAPFEIGRYIRREFQTYIPGYRVDFLLTLSRDGKEQSLILEYDGLEFHTKNPEIVTAQNFDREYLEYDLDRQVELEGYGYRFLRIHKFSLLPTEQDNTPIAVLDRKVREAFR